MRKLILIVHTSLDGFVAGINGEFDNFKPSPENLDFVCSLTDEADAALVGRMSYQMPESFWPTTRDNKKVIPSEIKYSNWYNDAEKIVISKSLSGSKNRATVISDNIAERIHGIKNRTGKNILMFGSPTTFEILNRLNLIDEYWVIQYPVFFGEGISFFTRVRNSNRLDLLNIIQMSRGEIALHYKVR
ncbi:dihydrofolate reductase [Algoriphagus sp. 4150]|uniref:dihydrofolate reductase family protein n=1 Tax=Algoriphagus sp. 4150 TaxID=2817756 RepID=UPI002856E16D|nr:dihydrofolate reductase family protein [Algoriphagus sp. 4150]MDR7131488.1 dihydrofolate reductase [Algoriphagus sp. 4150]